MISDMQLNLNNFKIHWLENPSIKNSKTVFYLENTHSRTLLNSFVSFKPPQYINIHFSCLEFQINWRIISRGVNSGNDNERMIHSKLEMKKISRHIFNVNHSSQVLKWRAKYIKKNSLIVSKRGWRISIISF